MFGTKAKLTIHLTGGCVKRLNWSVLQDVPEDSEQEGFGITGWMGHGVAMKPMVERNLVQQFGCPEAEAPLSRPNVGLAQEVQSEDAAACSLVRLTGRVARGPSSGRPTCCACVPKRCRSKSEDSVHPVGPTGGSGPTI